MSHFYGTLKGSRGDTTRCGTRNSGLVAIAASWSGCVRTQLYVDEAGRDCYRVSMEPWGGNGVSREIASGYIGE